MENREQVSGGDKKNFNQSGRDQNQKANTEKNFDTGNRGTEINPSRLNNQDEIDLDRSGVNNSKGHEPYEFSKNTTAQGQTGKGMDRDSNSGAKVSGNSTPEKKPGQTNQGSAGQQSGSSSNTKK